MKRLTKYLYAAVGAIVVVLQIVLYGGKIAAVQMLQLWAYPASFGVDMLLVGLVLIVLMPAGRNDASGWIGRKLAREEKRLKGGFWLWLRSKGSFPLVLVAAFFLGPFFGAVTIRFLGLEERRAWLYAFSTTLITNVIWVTIYLGGLAWVKSLLADTFLA